MVQPIINLSNGYGRENSLELFFSKKFPAHALRPVGCRAYILYKNIRGIDIKPNLNQNKAVFSLDMIFHLLRPNYMLIAFSKKI